MEESVNDEQMLVVVVVKEAGGSVVGSKHQTLVRSSSPTSTTLPRQNKHRFPAKMAFSPLLSVPTELLLAVTEAIDDGASLRSFALTCKLARLLAEPVLYRAVLVTTRSQASCLAKALHQQQPPTRAELVQALDLCDEEQVTPACAVDGEPFVNYGRWRSSATRPRWEALMQGYRALFLDAHSGAGLQNLQSCDDDPLVGRRQPQLTEFKPILTLPALQRLTVSCAVLGDDLADGLAAFAGITPLAHLELVECFVLQEALTAVLALPRALWSCHLGTMRHHTSPSNNYHEASPEQQLEALRQGLCNFTELHTLTLDGASALLFSTLLSQWAPPNLDQLRVIRHDEGTVLDHLTASVDYARIPGISSPFALHQYLPKLHHLDLFLSPEDGWNTEPL
ncbi:hypothetical protein B0H14DRAFT_3782947 [Mycena olivaceomarginata]|nr:hypothetical protein B0H14DRAFT_3782947 [Mycena olivaceomarginata]